MNAVGSVAGIVRLESLLSHHVVVEGLDDAAIFFGEGTLRFIRRTYTVVDV